MNIININDKMETKEGLFYEEINISENTKLLMVEINHLNLIPNYERISCLVRTMESKYKNEKAALQSFAGKCLMVYGLGNILNIEICESDILVGKGKYGKPFLINHNNINFNISHSGNYAICSISNRSTGVDIELTERKNADKLPLNKTFSIKERDCYNTEDFFKIWVMKESYLKMKGTGLSVDMTKIDIDDVSDCNFYTFSFDQYFVAVSESYI